MRAIALVLLATIVTPKGCIEEPDEPDVPVVEPMEEMPDDCRPWRSKSEDEPAPESWVSRWEFQDKYIPEMANRIHCDDDRSCFSKATLNILQLDPPTTCGTSDFDEELQAIEVICTRKIFDEYDNQTYEILLSCETERVCPDCCHEIGRYEKFVPRKIVTVEEVYKIFEEMCDNQRRRRDSCWSWCKDANPECGPHWGAMDSCSTAMELMKEMQDRGSDAISQFHRPD